MLRKTPSFLYAKYRAFAPISCFQSPRSDVLCGFKKWNWLVKQRRDGRMIEPDIRVQGDLADIKKCLLIEKGVNIDKGVIIWFGKKNGLIKLGERVYLGPYCYIGTGNHKLYIGADSMIGAQSYIITENHCTYRTDIPYAQQGYRGGDVVIGKNVWIGCHVTILPGVTIGDHAVIGAGSVVTKSIPPAQTWCGVPAKILKKS